MASHRADVIWRGPFILHRSLAVVNRELTLALLDSQRCEIDICHDGALGFSPAADPRLAPLAARLQEHPKSAAIPVHHQWPVDWNRPVNGAFVLVLPWEFGSAPRDWVDRIAAEAVDEVLVHLRFVRQGFLESGVPEDKVVVIPH